MLLDDVIPADKEHHFMIYFAGMQYSPLFLIGLLCVVLVSDLQLAACHLTFQEICERTK